MPGPARLPLNLYLLKPDISPARAASGVAQTPQSVTPVPPTAVHDGADNGDPPSESGWVETWVIDGELISAQLPAERDGTAALAVRATPGLPSWLSVFAALAPNAAQIFGQLNFGAVFFQPIGNEMVVWSFGTGWTMLDQSTTVERFGLRSGLNALLTSPPPSGVAVGIRELTSAVRASVTRRATVATARPSSPSAIERIDRTSDGATMAALTTGHRTFGRIEAGRSLRFDASVSRVWDLTRYATQAVRLHRRTDYQSNDDYRWIDFTVPVSDSAEIDRVLRGLWDQAQTASPPRIDALWADADPLSGVTPRTLRFPRERKADERRTLTWDLALTWIKGQTEATGNEALGTELRFYEDPDGPPSTKSPLWWHLVAQVEVDGSTYVISDGEIWKASAAYLADLNQTLANSLRVNPAYLPPYVPPEDEDTYNKRAAAHGSHLLIDKSLLRLPGQSPIEAADLLSSDGLLMHVKRRSRSSTMSHATAQAIGAAQLLRSSTEARTAIDSMLASVRPRPKAIKQMRDHCASFQGQTTATVQIVIVGDWRGTPDVAGLPLLTRLNLSAWLRQMPCNREIVLVGT